MKKIVLCVMCLLVSSMAFAQFDFAKAYQEEKIKQGLERELERAQIMSVRDNLPPTAKALYKKMSLHQRQLADLAFLYIARAQDAVEFVDFPRHHTRLDLEMFVSQFEEIYNFQRDFKAKTPISIVVSAAVLSTTFSSQDGKSFKIIDFLEDYQDDFVNLEQLRHAKLVVWHAILTLDSLALQEMQDKK